MKNDISIRAAVYLRAAELAEQRGIVKESYGYDTNGARCARGHLIDAAHELFGSVTILHQVERPGDYNIMGFNDHPDTTAAMVAAKLRKQAFGD